MEDMIYDDKKVEMSKWTAEHRLQYSWQVAKAMTELHSVGNIHDSAAISHTDVSTDQFLWVNGMFKVSDCIYSQRIILCLQRSYLLGRRLIKLTIILLCCMHLTGN